MIRRSLLLGIVVLLTATLPADSQWGRGVPNNEEYDGRFNFVRVYFEESSSYGYSRRGRGGGEPAWHHDYPTGERHLAQIVESMTTLKPGTHSANGAGVVFGLADPDLFKYPWAYLCEPGRWNPNEREVAALRTYLMKGGFIVFDDFADRDWTNFQYQILRVLPGAQLKELDASHPIYHIFYDFDDLGTLEPPPTKRGVDPVFLGIFEDNDPSRRLMAVINYNNDIGDFWEWSDRGWVPIDISNEAYKLGVNYIIYGLTY